MPICIVIPNATVEYKHTVKTKKKTIQFDESRVCDACRANEAKKAIDWESREKELIQLLDKYRKNDGSYDCLIPGSGGKDSAYQAHILNKFGFNIYTALPEE